RIGVALGDRPGARRQVGVDVGLPPGGGGHIDDQVGELVGGDGCAGDTQVLQVVGERHGRRLPCRRGGRGAGRRIDRLVVGGGWAASGDRQRDHQRRNREPRQVVNRA